MPQDQLRSRESLFLLPGLLCDATVWAAQIAHFAAEYEVTVPDLTGHSCLTDMARSVLELAPDSFSLAGHSMGARVALEVVRLAPERVKRLALLDTGTHPVRPGEPEQRQVLIDLAYAEGMHALCARWLPPMVAEHRLEDEALMGPLQAMVMRMSPEIYHRQVTALLNRPDAGVSLVQVRCPVLIGVGEQDRWSPPEQHLDMLKQVPNARYEVFVKSGHMAPAEASAAVSRALAQWLSEI